MTIRDGARPRSHATRPAVNKANPKLAKQKIEPIGAVTLHGLSRLLCTLRTVSGEDPVYVADQMGHTDPSFTLEPRPHLRPFPDGACRDRTGDLRLANSVELGPAEVSACRH